MIVAILSGTLACHRVDSEARAAERAHAANEIWLSSEQVDGAHLVVEPVAEHTIDDSLQLSGRIVFDDDLVAHVFSPITGRVTYVGAPLGARVAKGAALARIQSPDIGQASSDLGKADADLIAAERDYQRKKDLYAAKAESAASFEQAEDAYRQAKAERARAEQKARLLHAGSVDRVTQAYALSSPIDGEVLARTINPGMEVQGQYAGGGATELFTIGRTSRVWLMADVHEGDMPRIAIGARVTARLIAYPGREFVGVVDWASQALDPATRTARVRCVFDNPEGLLKPEMYASARVSATPIAALSIPRSALVQMGEQAVVIVQTTTSGKETRFERVPVTVDDDRAAAGEYVAVQHGLERGTRVVIRGAQTLASMF